jgi:hypothetical protein
MIFHFLLPADGMAWLHRQGGQGAGAGAFEKFKRWRKPTSPRR